MLSLFFDSIINNAEDFFSIHSVTFLSIMFKHIKITSKLPTSYIILHQYYGLHTRGNRLSANQKINVVTLENAVFAVFSGVSLFFDGW